MVYIKQWNDYTAQCRDLHHSNPSKTRYTFRYRHDRGLLVMKVTDDKICLKFKTRSTVYLNRFEIFSREMMVHAMAYKAAPPPPAAVVPSQLAASTLPPGSDDVALEGQAATGTAPGEGAKKKKKKGKKK